jgi:hypothetical protein
LNFLSAGMSLGIDEPRNLLILLKRAKYPSEILCLDLGEVLPR